MTKKPSRVRVLMMPYQDDDDRDPVGYLGPATVLTGLPRTIRLSNGTQSCPPIGVQC